MRPLVTFLLALACLSASMPDALAAIGPPGDVDPVLSQAIHDRGAAEALILLDLPDLSPAYTMADKDARGRWVYDTLRSASARAQASLIAELKRLGVAHRGFWASNAVSARLDAMTLARVIRLPGVRRAVPNLPVRALESVPASASVAGIDAVAWGVSRVEAPWAWNNGLTGQGGVIAGQDTGYRWQHEAIERAYRGFDPLTGTVDHDYNWHDAAHSNLGAPDGNVCGFDSPIPCDDYGHGTHTMGTMIGNDLDPALPAWPAGAANPIGVAPGARWIGCRNMENGWGSPATYIECFQFFIAPYPVGGDPWTDGEPSLAPDIVNNSWGCPPDEGCTGPEIEPAVDAADAAGILVVVSAGNSGSGCSTVSDPPAVYPRSFAVGATNSGDGLASFSSRGPAAYSGVALLRPDASAPGVSIASSTFGSDIGYGLMSGTSMAASHAAGIAALLISAEPGLRGQTALLRAILSRTAEPESDLTCGGDPSGVPNNSFGWGILNARRAIEALDQPGTLHGEVTDSASGLPVGEVSALLTLLPQETAAGDAITASDGAWSLSPLTGAYRLTLSRAGYDPGVVEPVMVIGGRSTSIARSLAAIPAIDTVVVAPAGTDVRLRWDLPAGNVAGYELWRGVTPQVAPFAAGSVLVGSGAPVCNAVGSTVTCVDAAGLGSADGFHAYTAVALGAGGGRSLPSPLAGVFTQALLP